VGKTHLIRSAAELIGVPFVKADATKFSEAFNSFSVNTKAGQARKLAEAYRIDGVPAIGVGGRFWTSGTLANTLERSLTVADQLIQRTRKSG
jgi:thiol:disulfide interchange protein DsbA